jgi:predicted outer membrane repeat protein
MVDAAHAFAASTSEFAVAWAGAGCELLVEAGASAASQHFSGAPIVQGEALSVTTGLVPGIGGRVVLRSAPSQACFAAYILLRESAGMRPPSAPTSPPLAPALSVGLHLDVAPACAGPGCNTLAAALVLAQTAPAGATVTIELADGTYDASDLASWPFDLGRVVAALELRAAPGATPALDAGGVTSVFIASLPTNVLTIRGLVIRNASAARWPHDGGAALVAAGQLNVDGCRFEANHAPGSGGAVALLDGTLRATATAFDDNSAGGGGGALAVLETAGPATSVNLTNTSFTRNRANSFGGAAWLMGGMSRFTACRFEGGSADASGGALQVAGSASFRVDGGSFTRNWAGSHGSAINFDPTSILSTASLGGSRFDNNTGLSTVKAAQFADWRCRPGEYAPRIGAFSGSWEGCAPQYSNRDHIAAYVISPA